MKTLITSALVCIVMAFSASANAQSFSFTASSEGDTQLGGIGPGGALYSGRHWGGSYTATFDGEEPQKGTYECVSTTQPPGLFMAHTACTMVQGDGSFTSSWGCNALGDEPTELLCVAGVYGRTGRFEGMVGGATSHNRGDETSGVGQFFKPGNQ